MSERFWSKVDIRGPDECWPWLATKCKGYGYVWWVDRKHYAHRVAYLLTYGMWPVVGRHRCHTPGCCNPAHVVDGTQQDNIQDTVESGHVPRGEGHWNAKLTPEAVRDIRHRRAAGERYASIAATHQISEATACQIATRQRWRHLP